MEFTHIANPVRVKARRITKIQESKIEIEGEECLAVEVEGDPVMPIRVLPPDMTARYIPVPGDYIVTQEDGYEYLNPKDVFERKYRVIASAADIPTFTSPIFGETRRPTDDELADIQRLADAVPVALFQELNRKFNERGLMCSIDVASETDPAPATH